MEMAPGKYRPRISDVQLERELSSMGAVLILGPKWCGKTTSAERLAKSALYMQDTDNSERYMEIAGTKPSLLLKGDKPRLIDEWQMAPVLWDSVRFSVDHSDENGMYILTGSTVVDRSSIKHSGTGRIARMRMWTMSLFESGKSTGEVSLRDLFYGSGCSGMSELSLENVAGLVIRGGWPRTVGKSDEEAYNNVKNYCESIVDSEIQTTEGKKHDPQKMRMILRSVSRCTGGQRADTGILDDMTPRDKDGNKGEPPMHINTLREYLSYLEDVYVVENLEAWSPRLRSKTSITTSPTRYLTDPAIAAYFMGSSVEDLLYDPETFGLLFESLVVRDLKIYAQALNGTVYHYRDRNGLECDTIVHLANGKWGAIEVKLGQGRVDEAAKNLLKLKSIVDSDTMNSPSFLAVIVATGYAYTREDGIHVIPIGCLRD